MARIHTCTGLDVLVFGTKGAAITFVSNTEDAEILNKVQERFEVNITQLPDELEINNYMAS